MPRLSYQSTGWSTFREVLWKCTQAPYPACTRMYGEPSVGTACPCRASPESSSRLRRCSGRGRRTVSTNASAQPDGSVRNEYKTGDKVVLQQLKSSDRVRLADHPRP